MAYKRKTDGIDPERGDKIQLRKSDVDAIAKLPPEISDPIFGAFVRWFAGGADTLPDMMSNTLLEVLKNKQREEVRHYIETCDGRSPSRDKSTQDGISRDKSTSATNESKRITNTNQTRNETKPGTATVSPSPLDRVSVSSSEIDNAITAAADLLGDKHPSSMVWADFIQRHGLDAFNAQVDAAATKTNVRNKGAYLNKLLEAYTPPPPAPMPQPPKTFNAPADWQLCAERCAHCTGSKCGKGHAIPPDKRDHPNPPEECRDFTQSKSAQSQTRQPPPLDFGAVLKRTNAKR